MTPVVLNDSLGLPPDSVKRSLTLIAKVIQSLANLNPVSYSGLGCVLSGQLTRM